MSRRAVSCSKQRFIDLGEALQNCGVRGNSFAQFDKRPNNINAHRDGTFASEYICCLERAVFGECPWAIFPVLAAPRL